MALRADADLAPRSGSPRVVRHPARALPQYHGHRSLMIGRLKLALPAIAAIILGLVFAWPQFRRIAEERFQVGFASLGMGAAENLTMVNARFHGLDRHNQPFAITAEAAVEDRPGSGLLLLDQPKADFLTGGGASVYVESNRGFYNQKTQILDMVGDVSLFHDEGYELHTDKARLDVKASSGEGQTPVRGHGPKGAIQGQGFVLLEKGGQIVVTGQSTLTVKGARAK